MQARLFVLIHTQWVNIDVVFLSVMASMTSTEMTTRPFSKPNA